MYKAQSFNARIGVSIIAISFIRLFLFFSSSNPAAAPLLSRAPSTIGTESAIESGFIEADDGAIDFTLAIADFAENTFAGENYDSVLRIREQKSGSSSRVARPAGSIFAVDLLGRRESRG